MSEMQKQAVNYQKERQCFFDSDGIDAVEVFQDGWKAALEIASQKIHTACKEVFDKRKSAMTWQEWANEITHVFNKP